MDPLFQARIIVTITLLMISFPMIKATLSAPFVPTPKKTLKKMFEQIQIKPGQLVYDLGCGDGRFVRYAARKYGARSIGIELNPFVYVYAKLRSLGRENEMIFFKDFTKVDLSEADYLICYLLPQTMVKIEDKLKKELKQGGKIISHAFKFRDWEAIQILTPQKKEYGKVYVFEKK